MAGRRNLLHGASSWEREEKATQQRDYAAQLQQQVQLKLAKQAKEKALRQQEQRQELEIVERDRAANQKQQTKELHPDPQLQIPTQTVSVQELSSVDLQPLGKDLASPLKLTSIDPVRNSPRPPLTEIGHSITATSAEATCGVPTFSSAPSIFESLLREPGIGARSITFYDELASLQRLSAELETAAKLRRTKNHKVKPDFWYQQESSAEMPSMECSPLKIGEGQVKHDENQVESQHTQPQFRKHLDGSLGESVLLPLGKAISSPPNKFSYGKSRTTSFLVSSPHQFDTQGNNEYELKEDTTKALDNHSEMVHFTPRAS